MIKKSAKMIAMLLLSAAPSLGFAQESVNLQSITAQYFPGFERSLTMVSKDGVCSLEIESSAKTMVYKFTMLGKVSKVELPLNFINQTVFEEQQGRHPEQGLYAYQKAYAGDDNNTLIQGVYYYEPSYDPADSSQYVVTEKKIYLEKNKTGVTVKYSERGPEKPRYYTCEF